MTQYLLSVYYPEGGSMPDPETLAQITANLESLNADLRKAGAWVFAGGLYPPSTATVLTPAPGEVLVTDGPYVESKEVLGGFSIIEAPELDAALDWGRRMAEAIGVPIEVRPIQSE
ncbi:YciI family protein [Diaminobutyricibacter sp. McL0608]|uniref:YciI family protein n=1 Tax=Leifsonia sp. McL0608 TaxID=3143537 RepID=UPI0031F31560